MSAAPEAAFGASAPLCVVTERCPYCTKGRNPRDMIRTTAGPICAECWQRHLAALEGLSIGKYLGECSECGKGVDEIRARQRDTDGVRMAVHFENGIYRPMCMACDARYTPKRRELYGGTEFAQGLRP